MRCDGLGGGGVVAGEHHRVDTRRMQVGDGLTGAFLVRVRYRKKRQDTGAVGQQRQASTLQRVQRMVSPVIRAWSMARAGHRHASPIHGAHPQVGVSAKPANA